MHAPGKKLSTLFLGLILLAAVHRAAAVEIAYKEPLEQLRMAFATSPGAQGVIPETARGLRFDAFGKSFDIQLEANRALLDAAQRAHLDKRYEIYRGTIAGLPGSWVRLVIAEGVPRGMLWDGEELMAIDVGREEGAVAADAYIYRLRDLKIPPGTLACSDIGNPRSAAELASAVIAEVGAATTLSGEATSEIDIAVIADYEFTDANGSGYDRSTYDSHEQCRWAVQYAAGRAAKRQSNRDIPGKR